MEAVCFCVTLRQASDILKLDIEFSWETHWCAWYVFVVWFTALFSIGHWQDWMKYDDVRTAVTGRARQHHSTGYNGRVTFSSDCRQTDLQRADCGRTVRRYAKLLGITNVNQGKYISYRWHFMLSIVVRYRLGEKCTTHLYATFKDHFNSQ
jgi:hypothetical protein